MKRLKSLAALLLLLHSAQAQSDSTQQKPQFKLSLNYNTALNYYGRADSLKSTGFFPLAELWLTSKFYVNAAPIFINNNQQTFAYAGTVATAGYQHVGTKWISSLSITKPFYQESSELVQSALKAQAGASFTFQNNILNITAGGDVKFSDKADYGATAGVDHVIRLQAGNNSELVFDPSIMAYAGTQNFQRSYYKKTKPGFLLFPGNGQQVTENVSRFNVLAYEVSVPIIYAAGKVMLLATPSYILPQNLVSVPGRPDLSEKGENLFYATFTAKYTF